MKKVVPESSPRNALPRYRLGLPNTIEKFYIHHETPKFMMSYKIGCAAPQRESINRYNNFKTWNEAHAYMIDRVTTMLQQHKDNVKLYQTALDRLQEMNEPKEPS